MCAMREQQARIANSFKRAHMDVVRQNIPSRLIWITRSSKIVADLASSTLTAGPSPASVPPPIVLDRQPVGPPLLIALGHQPVDPPLPIAQDRPPADLPPPIDQALQLAGPPLPIVQDHQPAAELWASHRRALRMKS
eukprot:TRINITY_DN74_c0_g1_i1.p1 TRINITY_DN74_c0_g1~~TRINITY_DN74_c0_g1_i1.p1  ORF type:complete len:137 (+),score=1.10 TRINITY_DN74_c0_g1_i1:126-536(+)